MKKRLNKHLATLAKSLIVITIISSNHIKGDEVSSWECYKFQNADIIGDEGVYLGKLGPKWLTDSIFNPSSRFSSTWSSESIFNTNGRFGNSYSNTSVFNESANKPPMIISELNVIGYLSTGPAWKSDRFSPYDIKYTCDWD